MNRNREDTRNRILEAALAVLAEEGFGPLGVNAVARRAGCDKKLIYRYFDGMEGLCAAMGEAVAEELTGALGPHLDPPPESYAAMMERLALALFDHLWGNPLYRQIKVMEVTAPAEMSLAFRRARGLALQDWLGRARAGVAVPAGADLAALNAVAIATVEGVCVLGPAGLNADDPATAGRLRRVLVQFIRAGYAGIGTDGPGAP
jgi:AcrR family transcriptional regulator